MIDVSSLIRSGDWRRCCIDTDAEAAITALTSTSTAEQIAKAFEAILDGGEAEDAQLLGHVLYKWNGLKDSVALKTAADNTSSPYYITGTDEASSLGNGYYLVKDTTATIGDDDVRSSAFLKILNNGTDVDDTVSGKTYQQTELTFKGSVPTVDKKSNSSDSSYSDHTSVAEGLPVQPGDTVYYELTGTFPSNYSDYNIIINSSILRPISRSIPLL